MKKRIFIALLAFLFISFHSIHAQVNYRVNGIYAMQQPTQNSCWATAFTILYNWKNQSNTDIRSALSNYGDQFVRLFDQSARVGIFSDNAKSLYDQAGLSVNSQSLTPKDWEYYLRSYGPLYININKAFHGVVVVSISGDGTSDGTTISYLNPAIGQEEFFKFSDFVQQYENGSEWPWQIVYWP